MTGGAKVLGPEVPDGGEPDAQPLPEPPPPPVGKPVEGIFVSSSKGADDTDGTKSRPLKTLAAAIKLATEKKGVLPVIACAETFTEAVKLGDGVTMYGNFDCTDPEWKFTTARAKIVSPTSPALLADGLKLPVRFEGFEVFAPDMTGTPAPGVAAASSFGAIVNDSKGLSFANVTFRAGAAQDGVDGAEPTQGNANLDDPNGARAGDPTERACDPPGPPTFGACNFDPHTLGSPATVAPGSLGGKSTCRTGPNGGAGGRGGSARISQNGVMRTPFDEVNLIGLAASATLATAAGGNPPPPGVAGRGPGTPGTPGTPGAVGQFGQNGIFQFGPNGFVPGDGTPGAPGLPGQGGGGGAGRRNFGATNGGFVTIPTPAEGIWRTGIGAGGGAGGCGGVSGTPGRGGGASIGLLVIGSADIKLSASRLQTAKAGRAGIGMPGTAGTAGGKGGGEASSGYQQSGTAGGDGGAGGAAGRSGSGSAGPSIALVFKGTRPATAGVELIPGTAGEGAPAVTIGSQTLPAVVGESKEELSLGL